MSKRLFIFAGYDPDSIIDDYVVWNVRKLSEIGDVIFYMDNDLTGSELDKISPFVLYSGANRHCGYDFGSYKHGFIWAKNQGLLNNYDFVYFVNDSVFGPFNPLTPILEQLESGGCDYFGLFPSTLNAPLHIQSWFFGMRRKIFISDWFAEFVNNICKFPNKIDYVWNYEVGLALYVKFHGCSIDYWYKDKDFISTHIYHMLPELYDIGNPFIKKLWFLDKNISYKNRVKQRKVLDYLPDAQRKMIVKHLTRICPGHVNKILTASNRGLIIRKLLKTVASVNYRKDNDFTIRIFGIRVLKIRSRPAK
jgi:lipopolysaccharide biosynthesis protein